MKSQKKKELNKIAINDYSLSVTPYVEPEDTHEVIDIVELNAEISKTVRKIDRLRADIDEIVKEIDSQKLVVISNLRMER